MSRSIAALFLASSIPGVAAAQPTRAIVPPAPVPVSASLGVPSGYSILGDTPTAPTGYTFHGVIETGTNEWSTMAPMPTARDGLAVVAVNGKVYAIGGSNGAALGTNEEYDPLTNTWRTSTLGQLATMPTARNVHAVAALNGKLYVFGGENSGYRRENEEYDPTLNQWTEKTKVPTARQGLAAAVANGKIYVIGGQNENGFLRTNEAYDPVTDTWNPNLKEMPTARSALVLVAANGNLYAIGGFNGAVLSTVEEYDPINDRWTPKSSMPTSRFGLAAAEVGGAIFAIGGGSGGSGVVQVNERYDPATDTWVAKAVMPTARVWTAGAQVNNKIHVVGGSNPYPGGYLQTNQEYSAPVVHYLFKKN